MEITLPKQMPSLILHQGQLGELSLETIHFYRSNIEFMDKLKIASVILLLVNGKYILSQMFSQVFSSKTMPRSFSQLFQRVRKDE